ncbi:hypothetical protein AGDE_09417 [Angomonas deanei]|uniref:Uncharacterized protein n=1 Tax=Angomonas deanei TaxID=59799 RepID=A0A7G2CIE3_9TRYP|nr:hypothetical protein AGDE_09417 [Angomonas deanei]CAD2219179.1 hypothetical protein, conserved [Angomonas deanei]|eukprot:EPY30491.1 hypothetical protein AGDE_09417 [Angomonas deanei]
MEERVSRCVYLQLNSPNFPQFCVTHANDPNYLFLFDAGENTTYRRERQLYLEVLKRERAKLQQQPNHNSNVHPTAPWWGTITDVPSLFNNCKKELAHTVYGPHAPLLFPSVQSLEEFVQYLFSLLVEEHTEASAESSVERLAGWCARRLPRTEYFLFVMNSILWDLVWFLMNEHTNNNNNNKDYVLFMARNIILLLFELYIQHKKLAPPNSGAEGVYYQAVFEHYTPELTQLFYEVAKRFQFGKGDGQSGVNLHEQCVQPVMDITDSWIVQETFSPSCLQQLASTLHLLKNE